MFGKLIERVGKRLSEKKKINPTVFIPTGPRIVAILQLCFAFSFLSWVLIQPYMNQYFTYHSQLSLYKTVMGHEDLLLKMEPEAAEIAAKKLGRNAARFQELPKEKQELIQKKLSHLSSYSHVTFTQKAKDAWHYLVNEVNPFALTWLILSITISLFLLLRIEGASQAAWLLPLIVICFGFSCYWQKPIENDATSIFPAESYLMRMYIKEPLHGTAAEQREQLMRGWKEYLVSEWGLQSIQDDFEQQVEEGEFRFNVARIELEKPEQERKSGSFPFLLISIYFLWNLFFAYACRPRALVEQVVV